MDRLQSHSARYEGKKTLVPVENRTQAIDNAFCRYIDQAIEAAHCCSVVHHKEIPGEKIAE
jgi:hypothetical protein